MPTAKEIATTFLSAHLAHNPEEASTLGFGEHAARLSDPSPSARARELVSARVAVRTAEAALASMSAPEPRDAAGVTNDAARLDLDAVLHAARFVVRTVEKDADAENLELALLPHAALQHAALHARTAADWDALARRAEAVPHYLATHRENVLRGAKDGRTPDREVVATFIDRLLPGAAEALEMLAADAARRGAGEKTVREIDRAARSAADAYRAFAQLVTEALVLSARDEVRLGPAEVRFRLHDVMGITRSVDELLAFARSALADAHERIARAAGAPAAAAPNRVQSTHGEIAAAVAAILAPRASSLAASIAIYDRHTRTATECVRTRELVPVPELALDYEPLPAAIADGGGVTNWPAPLANPGGHGHVLYAPDIAAHPLVSMKDLAIHEGIPGHYLQSVVWQRAFATGAIAPESAVRFLGVADPIAMSRGYFGTMMSVEGWAVHMQNTLFAEGFYDDGPETLFFAVCDAIRAVRVLLDLSMHAGDDSDESLIDLVARATFFPKPWAKAQVLRAKRIPLQGITYAVGADEIAAARRENAELSTLAFHGALLTNGPVPASRSSRSRR